MKRSKYVQLSLAASVAVAISGCGPSEKTYTIDQKFNFQSVQECVDQKFPVNVCSAAYMSAITEHRRLAPLYDSKADCDADFVADWCQQDSTGKFIPKLGGFELAANGEVTQSQLDAVKAQAPTSEASSGFGSGGMVNGLLAGMLISNMLNSNRGSYYSEPVYRYRDSRGSYANSTLSKRIESGTTFTKSNQAKYGSGYNSSTFQSSSAKAATSRGGFGSQASARSGWGGSKSSGRSSS